MLGLRAVTGAMAGATESGEGAVVPRGPVLLLLPDPDADAAVDRTVAGRPSVEFLVRSAREAGFAEAIAAPGASAAPAGVRSACSLDPVDAPALVVYDTAYVRAPLLRLMVLHPLEPGERYTIYDVEGRPAAVFHGRLARVADEMAVAESLDLPPEYEDGAAVRWVGDDDRRAAEATIFEDLGVPDLSVSPWDRWVVAHLLRWLAPWGRRPERVEFAALLLAVASGLLAMVRAVWGPAAGAAALTLAVTVQRALEPLRRIHDVPPPKDRLASAVRSIGHAAYLAGLTYRLVSDESRPMVASLVLLAVGVAAAFLALLRAREYLQGRVDGPLALQRAEGWIRRMGIEPAPWWRGLPALELIGFVLALSGRANLPWLIFVLASAARLWRWFVATESLRRPLAAGGAAAPATDAAAAGAPAHGHASRATDPDAPHPPQDAEIRGSEPVSTGPEV